jgi:hypothetical protein
MVLIGGSFLMGGDSGWGSLMSSPPYGHCFSIYIVDKLSDEQTVQGNSETTGLSLRRAKTTWEELRKQ